MNESDEESSSESSSSEDEDSTDNVRTTTKDIREEPPIVPVIRNPSHKAWILEKYDWNLFKRKKACLLSNYLVLVIWSAL